MARLYISLFGSYSVTLDGNPLCEFDSDKTRLLLAYLAVEAGKPQRRDHLVGLFWPEQPEAHARRSLSQALYNLRQLLGERGGTGALVKDTTPLTDGQFLLSEHLTVQFNPYSSYILDIRLFSDLLTACQDHHHHYLESCPDCMQRLVEVGALYQGDFLADLSLKDSIAFEEWALVQREHLHREGIEALGDLSQCHENRGELREALKIAWRQVEIDPLWEAGLHRLMRLLVLSGQSNAALEQYESYKRVLTSELAIPVEKETQVLVERLSREAGVVLPLTHLPVATFPLVGRKQELAELHCFLHDPNCRLLTILGPGGCGKTRLALEAARAAQYSFRDGVYFISLSAYQPSNPLWPLLAEVLRLPVREKEDPDRQIFDYLGEKQALLLFDSFEKALERVSWLADLLQSAPYLTVLVTSRAPLEISPEQVYSLGGMEVPMPDELETAEQFEAVQLFLAFARHRQPGFALDVHSRAGVVRICQLVQGLPLGLLLASTWAELYSLDEIAEQIERSLDFLVVSWSDMPTRQRSLRATFDYSWNLLTTEEQRLLTTLTAFQGGFTLSAIEPVSGTPARLLRALTDKSLVSRAPDSRYQIHDLVRQYAAGLLEQNQEFSAEVHTRHSHYYLEALGNWEKDLKSARQREALEVIDREAENLRAAWRWAVATQDWQGIATGLEGMSWYVDLRLRFAEGERACRTARESLVETGADIGLELRLLTWQSRFLNKQDQREAAQQLLDGGSLLLEKMQNQGLDIRRERAGWLFECAEAAYYTDRVAASLNYRNSLALYQELRDEWKAGATLMSLGELVHHSGNFMEAGKLLSEALVFLRRAGEPGYIARTLRWLAFNEVRLGHLGQAEQILRESVELRQASGIRLDIALVNDDLGTMISWSGKYAQGAALLEQSLAVYQELGYQPKEIWAQGMLGLLYLLQGLYPTARARAESCLKLASVAKAVREMALALYILGGAALGEGNYQVAFDQLEESLRLYRQSDQKDELGWALIAQAYAARGLGRVVQSHEHLYEAAQIVVAGCGFSTASLFIPAAALFVADRGDFEKALELYELAIRFPNVAQARWIEDIAGRQIMAAAATNLLPQLVLAARERGQQRDLFATAEELFKELTGNLESNKAG